MRPKKIDDQTILESLMAVIRNKGYEGASMNELAAATGLKKASLYHRFPGGKQEMTSEVLNFVCGWIEQNIFQVLADQDKAVQDRLDEVIQHIDALYQGGEGTCVFRSLSTDQGIELFGQQVQMGMARWIEAFEKFGLELGLDPDQAKEKAIHALVMVQGSLIVAKGLAEIQPFTNALKGIKQIYEV